MGCGASQERSVTTSNRSGGSWQKHASTSSAGSWTREDPSQCATLADLQDLMNYEHDLKRDTKKWTKADRDCRAIARRRRRSHAPAYRGARPARPALLHKNRARDPDRRVRFDDEDDVSPIPALGDFGPRLFREVYWTSDEFDRMFKERRILAIKAAKQRLANPQDTRKPDENESRRGMGIDPLEQSILGKRADRNARKKEERATIMRYQSQASRDGEDWDNIYEEVAKQAADERSAAYRISRQSASQAAALAAADHTQLMRESPSLADFLSATPSKAQRRNSRETPTRVDSLAAINELLMNVTDPSAAPALALSDVALSDGVPDESTTDGSSQWSTKRCDPLDKFHTLIRADSLNNHRWKKSERVFLSNDISESLSGESMKKELNLSKVANANRRKSVA